MIYEIMKRQRVSCSKCAGCKGVLYLTLTTIKERYPVSSAGRKEEDESNIQNKYAPVFDLYSVKTERSQCGKKQINCNHNGITLAK